MKIGFTICVLIFLSLPGFCKEVQLDTAESKVIWFGSKKVTGDTHQGTIDIKKASINLDSSLALKGGSIVFDMNSINNLDQTGKWKNKLEEHLKSDDFFHTKANPDSSFKIVSTKKLAANLYEVTGNLTLRGKTRPETFQLKIEKSRNKKGNHLIAKGEIEIDRTAYGVTYQSEKNLLKKLKKAAKDKIINDKIKLQLDLKTQSL